MNQILGFKWNRESIQIITRLVFKHQHVHCDGEDTCAIYQTVKAASLHSSRALKFKWITPSMYACIHVYVKQKQHEIKIL